MTTTTRGDAIVADYLARLAAALRELPADRRAEIVSDIGEHIAGARADMADGGDEAEVRNLLDRLGTPEQIAASAGVPEPAPPTRRGIGLEIAALILLNLGGLIVPVVGWFVGVALLWSSSKWTTRDKLIGTFVPPGGLSFLLVILPAGLLAARVERGCTVGPADAGLPPPCPVHGPPVWQTALLIAAGLILLALPFVTTFHLARKLRRA